MSQHSSLQRLPPRQYVCARHRSVLTVRIVGGLLLACAMAPLLARAGGSRGNPNPGVLPPHGEAFGQECGEWTAQWWQWALSIPTDQNPLLDETGADAARGQSGPVWFLAGISGAGGAVERTVTVPAGKALFFPVYNSVWVNTPDFGDAPWSPEQEAFARGQISDSVDAVTSLSAEIDGRPVRHLEAYRCQNEEPFMVNMPADNIYGIPAGTYGPSVTDGYWLMLAPLSKGRHTLHFTSTKDGKVQDVTYHIDVTSMNGREGHEEDRRRD